MVSSRRAPDEIHAHGRCEFVRSSGEVVRIGTSKDFALAVYLALHSDKKLARDTVAAAVWPEKSAVDARNSLRTSLTNLRRAFADGALDADRTHISLDASRVCLAQPSPEPGGDYAGDFLPGCDLEWAIDLRLEFRDAEVERITDEALELADEGHLEPALHRAQHASEVDPLSELAAETLVRILDQSGATVRATIASDRYKSRAARELGVVPTVERTSSHAINPLMNAAEWLIHRSQADALAMTAATFNEWRLLPLREAVAWHERVLALNPDDSSARRVVNAQRYCLLSLSGQMKPYLAEANRARESARTAGEEQLAGQLGISIAYGLLSAGEFDQSRSYAQEELDRSRHSRDRGYRADIAIQSGIILQHTGSRELAHRLWDEAEPVIREIGSPVSHAGVLILQAHRCLADDRLDDAVRKWEQARRIYEMFDPGRLQVWEALTYVDLKTHAGEHEEALGVLHRTLASPSGDIGQAAYHMARDMVAQIACKLGEFDTAARTFAECQISRKKHRCVPSIEESSLIQPVREKIQERLSPADLHRAFLEAQRKATGSAATA